MLPLAGDVNDEWITPELEYLGIQETFCPQGFSIDLFTDGHNNSKTPLFFTAQDNALKQDWGKTCKEEGVPLFGFANPPFSKPHKGRLEDGSTCTGLSAILKKAYVEMLLGFHSVFVLQNKSEANWFPHRLSMYPASAIYKITNGRIYFDVPAWYKQDPYGSEPTSGRCGLCIAVFSPIHTGIPIDDVISRQELRSSGQKVLKNQEVTS